MVFLRAPPTPTLAWMEPQESEGQEARLACLLHHKVLPWAGGESGEASEGCSPRDLARPSSSLCSNYTRVSAASVGAP